MNEMNNENEKTDKSTIIQDYTLFSSYLLDNYPVIIKDVGVNWPLTKCVSKEGNLDAINIMETFSHIDVPVDSPVSTGYGICSRQNMKMVEFLSRSISGESLYCKDWHIAQDVPNIYDLYSIPLIFYDDWLNSYWKWKKQSRDDYYFVYIGGPKTVTYMHHDVLCSYSWSVNLFGSKRWHLWPPNEVKSLHRTDHKYAILVDDARAGCYSEEEFPDVKPATCMIMEQHAGEAIFIPSGWYHMVENLGHTTSTPKSTDEGMNSGSTCHPENQLTVSLNHNWFNGFCIYEIWRFLYKELNLIRHEIIHLKPIDNNDSSPSHDTTAEINNNNNHNHTNTSRSSSNFPSSVFNHANTKSLSMSMSMSMSLSMERQEWFHHHEILMTANSKLNIKDFLELISSRVYLMIFYTSIKKIHPTATYDDIHQYHTDTSNPSNNTSKETSTSISTAIVDYDLFMVNIMDSSIFRSDCNWKEILCSEYTVSVHITRSEQDWMACELLQNKIIDKICNDDNFLSKYDANNDVNDNDKLLFEDYFGISRKSFELFLNELNKSNERNTSKTPDHFMHKHEINSHNNPLSHRDYHVKIINRITEEISFPMNALQYSALQIVHIIYEMISSDIMITYLNEIIFRDNPCNSETETGKDMSVNMELCLQNLIESIFEFFFV
eukprot:gene11654-24410_t